MLLFGLILLVVGIIFFIIMPTVAADSDDFFIGIFCGIILISGIVLVVASVTKNDSTKKSLKNNKMSIEVKVESLNGVEVSRDTIYVFTPITK